MKTRLAFAFFLLLFATGGCRQEKNNLRSPEISITGPFAGQTYSYLDTIFVTAEISHQQSIDYIEVALINEFATPVLPVLTFYPSGNHFSIESSLIIDDQLIESGEYPLRFKTVIDGEVFNKWVKINYNAEPRRFESLLLLTKKQGPLYTLLDALPGNIFQERFSFTGDYTGSAVSSVNHLFFTAGKIMNNLSAWDLERNTVSWSVPSFPAPPLPSFTTIYSDGTEVFVSTRDALVKGYSGSGSNTFRSQSFSNGYFTSLIRHKSWIMAVFEPFNSVFNELVAFNYPGGTVYRRIQFQGKVEGMADFGQDGILLFINEESGAAVYEYSFNLNTLIKLKAFPQGSIHDLIMPDVDNAFIAFDDGIYWYRPDIASIVRILPLNDVSDLAFEALSGTLLIAQAKTVFQYQVPSFILLETYSLPDSLTGIHLLYNK